MDLTALSDDDLARLYQQAKGTTQTLSARGEPLSWGDVGSQAISNIPSSAGKLVSDMAQPFLHPVETAGNMHKLFSGMGAKFGYGDPQNEQYADAAGQFLKDRYGGYENIKRTIAEDPVGALTDAGAVLTGGAALPAKIPGMVGKTAEIVGGVGRAIDPLTNVARGVKLGANAAANSVGMLSGTGGMPVKTAFNAGLAAGYEPMRAEAFTSNLRGFEPIDNVVSDAKRALGNMRAERGAEYRKGMEGVAADKTELSFEPLANSLVDTNKIKQFHGSDTSPHTQPVRNEILQALDEWQLNAQENPAFKTAEGFDALKQKIGSIRDSLPFNTPQRTIAEQAYNSVRDTITKQAPEYAKVMSGYEKASNVIQEAERALSLGKKASVDTALRKLQSVTRNNVNTNYGKRADIAQTLANSGAPDLMEKLAGQSMNSWTPRGLQSVTAGGGILAALSGAVSPHILATLPLTSPRLVGEGAYYAGRAASKLPSMGTSRNAYIAALLAGRNQ